MTDEEIKRRAVVTVTKTSGRNAPNGLSDPRMGIDKRGQVCPTCRQRDCSGHFGMIELGTPVVRFGAVNETKNVLQCVCEHCSRPRWLPASVSFSAFHAFRVKLSEETRARMGLPDDARLEEMEV